MYKENDLAVVVGTRFTNDWKLRQDVIDRLDKTVELYHQGKIRKILVSGKWTVWYDWLNIVPRTTEAQLMKSYLVNRGVRSRNIVKEERSKDTIGNIYYLRTFLQTHPDYKKILIICASQRIERIRFLVTKFIGPAYSVSYLTLNSPQDEQSSLGSEATTLRLQRVFLRGVTHDNLLRMKHQLYNGKYYVDQARAVRSGKRKNELL